MKYNGTINERLKDGKTYYSHQTFENGRQHSKALSEMDAYSLAFKIYFRGNDVDEFLNHKFNLSVVYGDALYSLTKDAKYYEKRYCYKDIESFVRSSNYMGRVLVLYGLRRTGKTTLIYQTINSFSIKDFSKVAYIKANEKNTFYDLIDDLKYLISNGIEYIFIDEITLLDDFIVMSSTLSDIYGTMAKIFVSGTDSLGFTIASHHELFDRSYMVHTTYIPFKEFSKVLGIDSIDEYIEYGGTMSKEGLDYNRVIKVNDDTVNEYTDSAIAHNIVHSLKVYKDGRYFSRLFPLYERGELENAINRIVEDVNHRFAISVIEREFKSHDFGSLKQLTENKTNVELLGGVLTNVNEKQLTEDLMNALSIINKDKQSIKIDEDVILEIEYFLKELDVLKEVSVVNGVTFKKEKRHVFTQPGLRYSQAKALVNILLSDSSLMKYPESILKLLKEKLLSDVKGRMIEDLVLLEVSSEREDAFKFVFPLKGEYDLVILNDENFSSDIFEIKYSTSINEKQYSYLLNNELKEYFENKYYPIRNRYVVYRGENKTLSNGVNYLNIEEFLKSL